MKLLHEFHKPEVITKAAEEIRRRADPIRHYRIMEVCGGHTHAICSFGLKDVLPTPWLLPRTEESAWRLPGTIADSIPWNR
jgi:hydrogenase expression/formation protein HypD